MKVGEDHFNYSYRELNWKYIDGDPTSVGQSYYDWRYRYNAMGEREQKRLYHAPLPDSTAGVTYPWEYYLLGGSKEQLSVWQGQQINRAFCDTLNWRRVYLYPTEYITCGLGYTGVKEDISPLITRPDGTKEFRISDHLASLRVSVKGSTTKLFDYDPWGTLLSGSSASRRTFNDREEDHESGLFSNGVRKYDDARRREVWEC